jgi:hypothetical protein
MADRAEIHVGDKGTQYRVRITDAGAPFDPTTASTKSLIFRLPSGTVTKTATVSHVGDDYFLIYTVTDATFHAVPGRFSLQAYLVFADGTTYHSSVQTLDADGAALAIAPNLS